MNLEEILDSFEFLDDWDDRYKYLIELGNQLPAMAPERQTPETKVRGCASQVWIDSDISGGSDPVLEFTGTSDAHIVRGLIAVTFAIFSGKRASEIIATDEQAIFGRLQLSQHITPQRSNGLRSMVARIKETAGKVLAERQGASAGQA